MNTLWVIHNMKCKYAWAHLDFKKGGYAPCFRFKRDDFVESDNDKLPSEVINNSDFIKVRQQLRSGEFPRGCIDCKLQEDAGVSSYRTRSLESLIHISEPDYDSDIVVIKDLQIKATRACNCECRHCDTSSNSRFELRGKAFPKIETRLKEEFGFSHISKPISKIPVPTPEILDDLFENVIPNGVEAIEFSGGEPFYTRDMYKTLQRMIDDPNIDTKKILLIYNTNMSILEYKGYNVKDLWPHFGNVDVTVSMDGTGSLFNYFRTGGDYQTVINNIKEIAPYVHKFLFVCTTSAYQAFYMNEIYKDLNDIRDSIDTQANIRATFVHWPKALDIVNLDTDIKERLLEETEENDFTQEFLTRLMGKRTTNEMHDEQFKDLVKLQDELYSVTAKEMAPKIWDYVNA